MKALTEAEVYFNCFNKKSRRLTKFYYLYSDAQKIPRKSQRMRTNQQ